MTQTGQLVRLKRASLVAGSTALAVTVAAWALGIRVNTSPSLPTGLYIASAANRAAIAVFCPAEPYGSLALRRGYRTTGSCPDGGTPLMKPIIAEGGAVVISTEAGIAVNGRLLPNTGPRVADSQNRPLDHFPFGMYRLTPGTVWVTSSHNARSYDSRYFGPISTSLIQARVRPLITLD